MTHGDDNGLRIPPLLAPIELVIVPIWKTRRRARKVLEAADRVRDELRRGSGRGDDRIRVHVDEREGVKPGAKYYEWELRGIPLRLELGPRDLAKEQASWCGATRARRRRFRYEHRRGRREGSCDHPGGHAGRGDRAT